MKLGGFVMMLTGMMLVLTFVGFPTAFTSTLDTLGFNINPETAEFVGMDVEGGGFFQKVFGSSGGVLILLGGAAIVTIGLFARGYDPSLIILPFIVFIASLFIGTFGIIIKYMAGLNQGWLTAIIVIIFGALSVKFIMSLVDYFAGR